GLGMGVVYPTISVAVLGLAAAGEEGAVSAALTLAESLSVAVAAGLGGAIIAVARESGWGETPGVGGAYVLGVAGLALGLLVTRNLRGAGTERAGPLLVQPAATGD
ncbi:MAG TPA: hypothetical protein VFD32_22675, partial [Dehalococcoidia bacterium]|nr:hypothetical protein [Dehalococcoidia bacterium]